MKLTGSAIIERRRNDGSVIDKIEIKNLVVSSGKERVAKLILDDESGLTGYNTIAIGEGTTNAVVGDTALEIESTRAIATKAYEASFKAVYEYTFNFASGESYNITEAGIFDGIGVSASAMFDRFVFSARVVDSDTPLYIEITITVS